MTGDLSDIDRAAKAALSPIEFGAYAQYRYDLLASGESIESIREILIGWIWDATEETP